MEGKHESAEERTSPIVDTPSFDASTLTRDMPLADRYEVIVFDPDDDDDGGGTVEVSISASGAAQ
jgi:hypothetical protein